MAITDKKISTVYNGRDIVSLSDRPNADGMSASDLKARFDQLGKEIIPKLNALIDELFSDLYSDSTQDGHTHNLDNIVDGITYKLFTALERAKLSAIAENAEVNQNAFSNVKVGSSTIASSAKTDTFELVAGLNVSIAVDSLTKKITLSATGDLATEAVQSYIEDIGNYFTSLNVEGALQEVGANLTEVKSQLAQIVTHATKFGVKADWDGTTGTDNTLAIQNVVDSLKDSKGGVVLLPNGRILVNGSIRLHEGVTIQGSGNYNIATDKSQTTIYHRPTNAGTDLFIEGDGISLGYLSGVSIKNIALMGSVNSRNAIYIKNPSNLLVDNCYIANGFDVGFVGHMTIHSKISNTKIERCSEACIKFLGTGSETVSTTTIFDNCYLRESPWAIIAESESCLGIYFDNCTLESTDIGGANIYVDNKIFFNNLYTEYIPRAQTDNEGAILRLGVDGTPKFADVPTLIVGINGGSVQGRGLDSPNFSCINTGKVATVTATSVNFMNAGKLFKIAPSSQSRSILLLNCSSNGVTPLTTAELKMKHVVFVSFNEGNVILPTRLPQLNFAGTSNYNFIDEYFLTDSDFSLRKGLTRVVRYDAVGNVCNYYDYGMGAAEKVHAFGSIDTPNFAGVGIGAFLWAETANGRVQFRIRDSQGNFSLLGDKRGTTANRNDTSVNVGMCYFDTTLGKPIWLKSLNPHVWVDSNGVVV